MNNKWIAVLFVLILVAGGFFLFKDRGEAPVREIDIINETSQKDEDSQASDTPSGVLNNPTISPAPKPAESSPSTPSTAPNAPTVREFLIDNDHFSFKPSAITVNKGDTVKITFRNTGGVHDLKLDEFPGAATKILSAGQAETITFVADKSGSFEYYCSVGNHRAQGMWGTLTVK